MTESSQTQEVSAARATFNFVADHAATFARQANVVATVFQPALREASAYNSMNHWDIDDLVKNTHKAHRLAVLLRKLYHDEIEIAEADRLAVKIINS